MNYLVHLYLSDPSARCLVGTMMGDFVKGPLGSAYHPETLRGIVLHRRVDSFANSNPHFRSSRNRLDPRFGHCRAIMIDLFYDHFMARNWEQYAAIPLERFARRVYTALEAHREELPDGLCRILPRMIAHDWLSSYREVETIGTVLERVAARLKRPTPMAEGLEELTRHYLPLERDFARFLAEARDYVETLD